MKLIYRPEHSENRMKHEGDIPLARNSYFTHKNNNLKFLLKNRYEWMDIYIHLEDKGVEVGCGTGLSKEFIRNKDYLLTDYANYEWLDRKNIDALNTPFDNESFNFVISSNMIHHTPYPKKFFNEVWRILKPGGVLLIQEINCSLLMRFLLRLMKHEGYNFSANVFSDTEICTDPDDLWSANCAIPNLLFDDLIKFEKEVRGYKVIKTGYSEVINFINSSGVIAKTFYIPLPFFMLKIVDIFDTILSNLLPNIFALQRKVVLQKITQD